MDPALLLLLIILIGIPALAFGSMRLVDRRDRAKQEAILASDFPPEWKAIVERNVPLFRRLPIDLQAQLEQDIKLFLAKTHYEGCGIDLVDEIRVTIAAQACLIALGRRSKELYPMP